MKVFIVLAVASFVSCAAAGHLYGAGEQGSSTQFRSEDNYGNYNFGYDESHTSGASSRREERHGHMVRGSYRLGDADGRQRTVDYIADATGFHANVHTNEPGVDQSREPANVNYAGKALAIAGPAPVYSAPAAPAYSAPAYSAPAYSAPAYSAPVYSAPAAPAYSAPAYSAPAAPVYSAPAAPAYSAPAYSAPAYSAPAAPVYSAPVYEAPRTPFAYSFGTTHQASYAAPVAPIATGYSRY